MPALGNARHERFAQELAKGKSASQAYEDAGYKPNRQAASRLLSNVDIEHRLSELKQQGAIQTGFTLERISQMMIEDREFARENGQAGPAGQATERLAKLHGHYVEKQEHTHHTVSDEPLEAPESEWETEFGGQRPH